MGEATTQFTREDIDAALDELAEFMERTLDVLDVDDATEVDLQFDGERIQAKLSGSDDDVALLIGKRGQTLDAIQFLANAVLLSQLDKPILADLDAQGYRERRARQLQKVADRGLAELMKTGGTVELEAMTSSERKAIHNYLKDNADVETFSVGNEPNRRLTLSLRD